MVGRVALGFAWCIELMALIASLATGGKFPTATKYWVVTAITVLATIYALTFRQKHKVYDQPSPIATNFQSWLVLGIVALYFAICLWVFWPGDLIPIN